MTFALKQFEIGPMQNLGYLIGDEKSRSALIVDPAWAPAQLLRIVEKEEFKLAGFVITHAHYDHVNAIEHLLSQVDVPVYANIEEIAYAKAGSSVVGDLGRTVKGLHGGEKIRLGETEVECLHTPGHTPGSQCLRVGNFLVTGDTLFIGGCGRSDLPGGNPDLLFQSLQKISKLPSDLVICPGHDYGNAKQKPLGEEKAKNPYLQMPSSDEFINALS